MIRLSRSFDTFNDVLNELSGLQYADDIIDFKNIENPQDIYYSYDEIVSFILSAAMGSIPGINNVSYPNCISLSVNAYGFSYMKDNIGFGISTKYNRKTEEISYILTLSFNKDKALLKTNSIYNRAIQSGYEVKETVKNPKK